MKKYILFLILLGVLTLPGVALGQTLPGIVNNVAVTISAAALGVVIICWIITGLLFLTALGNTERLSTAKRALFWAVIGTVVLVLGGSVVIIIKNAMGV